MKKIKLPKWIKNLFNFGQPNFRKESEKSKRSKLLFKIYFDDCYGFNSVPNTPSTFEMGVCKLEYKEKENKLMVYLRRPGLLIGERGHTIDSLEKHLGCSVGIVEVNL